ncbi:MAG: Rv1355c family protein [Cryomorphaceae bacterium]|nr:Rv1355c family protein [Cryomorphaceae bacterium]
MSTNNVKDIIDCCQQSIDTINWQPVFFDPKSSQDVTALKQVIDNNPHIQVHDEICNQLGELVKTLHPTIKLKGADLQNAIKKHVGDTPLHEYGMWVYYPWSQRLVHILGKDEYIRARTSRNMYKITPEEQDKLATQKIGVVGLSVGQSVSLTLAMERICGEIRLTDFDILELSNLNRIRTGIHTLGLKKVYAVAREIAEIDPYIKVVCYPNGLNDDNMDSFFCEGGKLDLLIEESDGLDIKILSRHKARSLGVPVLMEASDRCMVDVERFDLEPKRPILHGLIDHLEPEKLKSLKTNEEKIPYMLDILGIETCSNRLKASMLEIEQTITTWPQLASAVIMGGGITADVARRILLGQFNESGRYHVDIEELIGNRETEQPTNPKPLRENHHEDFAKNGMDAIKHTYQPKTDGIPEEHLKRIVEAACLAPSGGNAQPWNWYAKGDRLFLINPFHTDHNILGYGNRANFVAQGAAIENLKWKAAELGYDVEVDFKPSYIGNPNVIAGIQFISNQSATKNAELSAAIGLRLTNRANEQRIELDSESIDALQKTVGDYGSELTFFTHQDEINQLQHVLGEMERIRILEKIGHKDFVNEIRWSDEEAKKHKDGIELGSIDLSISERAGLFVAKDPKVVGLLRDWNLGGAFSKLTRKTVESASVIGVLRMDDWSEKSFFYGGQILERIWLKANQLGISFQPTAASVFMRLRYEAGDKGGLSAETRKLVSDVLPTYQKALNKGDTNKKDVFIFRLNMASRETQRSIRKPLNEVFFYGQ